MAQDERFAALECSYFCDGAWVPFTPNSATPFPLKSPWFDGKALLLIATPEAPSGDRYQKTMFPTPTRRLTELQIQGKFKMRPQGALFVGGELSSDRMQVSALTRLVARGAFAFLRSSGGDGLHYSFGDDRQPPHISTPLWSSMPWVRVGGEPFELGSSSVGLEGMEDKAIRRSSPDEADAMLANRSASGDTTTWILEAGSLVATREWEVRLPGLPSLDLHRLWRDSALIVAIYFIEGLTQCSASSDAHDADRKRYLARIRIRHVGAANKKMIRSAKPCTPTNAGRDDALFEQSNVEDDDDEDSDESAAAQARTEADSPHQPRPVRKMVAQLVDRVVTTSPSRRRLVEACASSVIQHKQIEHHGNASALIMESSSARCLARLLTASSGSTSSGRLIEYYVVSMRRRGDVWLVKRRGAALVSLQTAARLTGDRGGQSRVSAAERRRRRFDATVAALSHNTSEDTFLSAWLPKSASEFLAVVLQAGDDKWQKCEAMVGVIMAGPALRASSTRSWREEWCALSPTGLTFYSVAKVASFHIDLADVVAVEAIREVSPTTRAPRRPSPFSASHSFQLSCVEVVLRIVVRDSSTRDAWVEAINKQRRNRPLLDSSADDYDDGILCKPTAALVRAGLAAPGDDWLPRGRFVLNARRQFDDDRDGGVVLSAAEAAQLAETMVRLVDELVEADFDDDDRLGRWTRFVELAGRLRDIDVPPASPAFWANVYHAMLAHAAQLLGSPTKASQWARYFGTLSYECAGDVFSIAELEHCVIRAAMPRPRLLLGDVANFGASIDLLRVAFATSAALSSPYSFALNVKDIRLVLGLNPGSVSDSPSIIPIYDAFDDVRFELQLDAASRRSLANVTFDPHTMTVRLPRICAWHSLSLTELQPYLPEEARRVPLHARIVYLPFDFACRIPSVLLDDERTPVQEGQEERNCQASPLAFQRAVLDAIKLTPFTISRAFRSTDSPTPPLDNPAHSMPWSFFQVVEDYLFPPAQHSSVPS